MILDARALPTGTEYESAVCIVGGGIAGITIALELAMYGVDVCLLEGGGLRYSRKSQSLYDGDTEGHNYNLLTTRTRFLGGSSNCWGGWCQRFSSIDFRERNWIADSGWPIGAEALNDYYDRATEILQVNNWSNRAILQGHSGDLKRHMFPFDPEVLGTLISPLSPPTRFGIRYREALVRSQNVRVLLHANAIEIETNAEGSQATGIKVKTEAGSALRAKAKIIILAAGGIENPRLLLLSNAVQTKGLGNQSGNVGRYFMDHPRLRTGRVYLKNPVTFQRLYDTTYYHRNSALRARGQVVGACLTIAESIQESEGMLQVHTGLNGCYLGEDHSAVGKAKDVYKAITQADLRSIPSDAIASMLAGLPAVAVAYIGRAIRHRYLLRYFKFESVIEPQPDPNNRVSLADERDWLGLQKVRVSWRVGELERRSHQRALQLIKAQIESNGLGRVELDEADWDERWEHSVLSTWHHMGTTRMHQNPSIGVVDVNCCLYGVSNLYIAGSSVFPTGTGQPPTLTIVALAIRLSHHIRTVLG
jgi:choline dehydrogenase-like flavoprotein